MRPQLYGPHGKDVIGDGRGGGRALLVAAAVPLARRRRVQLARAATLQVVARAVRVDGFARQDGGWRLPAMHSPVGDLHDLVLPLRITEAYL